MKLLIAEDNEDSRVYLKQALEGSGYQVTAVTNGVEALQAARKERPDLIISDIMMPEMDGFRLCRAIKSDEALKIIPFVFYTATYLDPENQEFGHALGASRYLIKPMEMPALLAAVKEVMAESEAGEPRVPEAPSLKHKEFDEMYEYALARKLDKKMAELELDRQRFAALYTLTQMKDSSVEELASFALESEVKLTNSRVGYLHFVEEDEKTIKLSIWSKETLKQSTAEASSHYSLEEAGVWADCMRYRKPVIHNDYQRLENKKGVPEAHFPLERHMSVPIFDKGKIVAIIGVGNKKTPYYESDAHQLNLFGTSMWGIILQKRAEQELRDIKRYLQDVFNSMPSILIGVEKGGSIRQWNEAAEKVSGISQQEAQGQRVWKLFPLLQGYSAQLKLSLETQQPYRAHGVKYMKGDATHYADIMFYPLTTEAGNEAVIRIDDITERVRIEEMMVQTEKMLSAGSLAAGIAHEINNPLSSVMMGIQNVLRRIAPELAKNVDVAQELQLDLRKVNNYLNERRVISTLEGIREAGYRASAIVDNMLKFSRKSEHRFEMSDLRELVDRALELAAVEYDLKKKYDFRRIRIEKDYDPLLPPVPCIPAEIEQVLLNLVRNAAQAMQEHTALEETPSIRITTRMHGDYVQLELADNGPGMDLEIQRRVFEPFFTTKKEGQGTGLGLSVSYFIITDNHGGRFRVESEPGHGAKFTIELPLEKKS